MSGRLRLELFGGFNASWENGQPFRLPTRKTEGLLAYLALPAGRAHSRDTLATLLWGNTAEAQARQSLRQALGSIRRALGEEHASMLRAEGNTIALDPASLTVDAAELEAALAAGAMDRLESAIALYKGDLLAGFRLDEASFEEWRTMQRERLSELVLEALAKALRQYLRGEHLEAATQTAMRLLVIDPLQEAVHRTLMRLLLRQGRRAAALQQYQTCVAALQRELGIEPEEETRQLYREALSTPPRSPAGAASSPPDVPAPLAAIDTAVIGREVELEHLRGAVPRMLDHGGHVVLVSGEAGIGKSRLIQEFLRGDSTRWARIVAGRCHQTEQTLPFRPWVEALRGDGSALAADTRDRLAAGTRRQLAALFPELAVATDGPIGANAPPALLFEPMLELLGVMAADDPLVVVIEDLHWADTMSTRLLAFVGRRIDRLPVLIVASTRPEELVDAPALVAALKELRDDRRLDEIALGPLSEADSRALAHALHPSPRASREWDEAVHDIWTVSNGNPFVIVESMRSVQQNARHAPASAALRVGRRVHEMVAARLERLAELPRQCVAVAAAIGRDFSFALLARAAGLNEREAATAVEELVRRRILDSVGDRLDFCHDWIRLVAYESLLHPRRVLLHSAIGEALEALHLDCPDDVADQLGAHYSTAANFRKAIPHLIRFADLTAQRYALDDASRALGQAMVAVDHLPTSEQDRWRLDVALRQAYVLSILGRQQEILELLQAHARVAERVTDTRVTSEYFFRLGLTHFFLGNRAQAQRAARQALAHGERSGNAEGIGKALHVLSLEAYEMGLPEDGIAHATRAISVLDAPHTQPWLALAYQDLALNYVVAGQLDAALAATKQVEEIGRASIPRLVAFAAYVEAWIHALLGATQTAVETARRGLTISRDKTVGGLLSGALGQAHLEAGNAGSAIAHLAEALEQLEGAPVRHVQIRYTALLGEAHLLGGDVARARALAERALALAQASAMPLNIGIAHRALGRIARAEGDVEAADRAFADALKTFDGCRATFESARTRVDLAGLRGARGDKDSAHEHLTMALRVFQAANASVRAEAVSDLGARLGVGPATGAAPRPHAVTR